MKFGEWLQAERERQGFTLEQVEEETKIRRFYIEALEKDNFAVLPPKVYASGFVKRYGKFLGLDEQLLVEEFQRLAFADEIEEKTDQVIPMRPNEPLERRYKPKNIIAGIVFLVVVIWLGSYLVPLIISDIKEAEPGPATPQETQQQKSPAKSPAVKNDRLTLIIEAQEPCWLLVMVDGQKQLEMVVPAGKKLEYTGKEKIYIKAGNAGGLTMTFNGRKQKPLGASGAVAEKEFTI